MKAQGRKRLPLVQGPFFRENGSRYWICRVDSRRRIQIPKELWEEEGWQVGDRFSWTIQETEGQTSLIVTNLDAMARRENHRDLADGAVP